MCINNFPPASAAATLRAAPPALPDAMPLFGLRLPVGADATPKSGQSAAPQTASSLRSPMLNPLLPRL